MTTLRAGDLRDRVTIQRKSAGADEDGTPLPSAWEDHAAMWANVRHQSGSEAIRGNAQVSAVRASIRIRWRVGLSAGMRVVHSGQVYDIEAVLPGARREHVDLVCKLTQ